MTVTAFDPQVAPGDPSLAGIALAASPRSLAEAVATIVVAHGSSADLGEIEAHAGPRHAVIDLTGAERMRFAQARYRSVAFDPVRMPA